MATVGRWQDAVTLALELGLGASRNPPATDVWNTAVWDTASWSGLEPYWITVDPCDVLAVSTRRGRRRVWEAFDAGTMTADVLDEHGQWSFVPATPIGQQELRAGSPVRLTATHAGVTYPLWRGYVEAVPEAFTDGPPVVSIQAQDVLGQLARQVLAERPAVGAGELADVRVGRLLDAATWPTAWRTITPGAARVSATTMGAGALDELADVAFGDGGYLFGGANGYVVFHGGGWAFSNPDSTNVRVDLGNGDTAPCPATIDVIRASDDLANDITLVRNVAGAVPVHVEDTASIGLYGRRSEPVRAVWLADDLDVQDRAAMLLEERAGTTLDPETGAPLDVLRIDAVAVNPEVAGQWPVFLAVDIGWRVRVTYEHPRHGWTWTQDGLVQSVAHDVTGDRWTVTLGLDQVPVFTTGTARWDTAVWDTAVWVVP